MLYKHMDGFPLTFTTPYPTTRYIELWRFDKEQKFHNLWGMNLKNPTPTLPEGEGFPQGFPPLRGGQAGVS
jgi:hypothetical protein